MKKKKIVITGGHLTPALAVIEELIKSGNWEIFFFGRKYATEAERTPSMESEVITKKGIWFIPIRAGRFQRKFSPQTVPAVLRIPLGFAQAFWHLVRIRPKVILSFGGYLSVPVVFAGWLLRIPSITHEQTVVLGLANMINSFFVKKVALSWEQSLELLPKGKAILTGNPIRKGIFQVDKKMWAIFDFEKSLPLVFITGGNLGSHVINSVVLNALPGLLKTANVFHQCGHLKAFGDFEKLQKVRAKLPLRLKNRYHVKKYLTGEEMGTLLNKADLVVSRAGANITTEVAALGKPTIFIPIPWSYADEQNKNAQMLVEKSIAEILPQKKLSAKSLVQKIKKIITNLDEYQKNASKAKRLVRLNAPKRIVNLVEAQTK